MIMSERRPRRRRWTIGASLLLVALIAVGLAIERRVREWQILRRAHPGLATIQDLALGRTHQCAECHSAPMPRPDAMGRLVGTVLDEFAGRRPASSAIPGHSLAFSSQRPTMNQGADCRKCHAP
jgi:hypothetical protein